MLRILPREELLAAAKAAQKWPKGDQKPFVILPDGRKLTTAYFPRPQHRAAVCCPAMTIAILRYDALAPDHKAEYDREMPAEDDECWSPFADLLMRSFRQLEDEYERNFASSFREMLESQPRLLAQHLRSLAAVE